MRRWLTICSTLLLTCVLTAAPLLAQAAGQAPKDTDGFVSISELPPNQQLPAAPYLVGAYAFIWVALLGSLVDLAEARKGRAGHEGARTAEKRAVTAAHFIFIPSVMLVGLVIGWTLGSRAARDAYSSELRKREEKMARKQNAANNPGGPARPS